MDMEWRIEECREVAEEVDVTPNKELENNWITEANTIKNTERNIRPSRLIPIKITSCTSINSMSVY